MSTNGPGQSGLAQIWPACIAVSAVLLAVTSAVATTSYLHRTNADSKGPIHLPPQSDSQAPSVPTKEADAKSGKVKRWKKLHEYWNEHESTWKTRDDVEKSAEELESAKKLLFTVKYRTNSPESDPEIQVEIHSKAIAAVLRQIRQLMKASDEVYETLPRIDAEHLFRARLLLKNFIEHKRKEINAGKFRAEPEVKEDETASTNEEHSRSKGKQQPTKAELEEQVDHIEELLLFVSEEYAGVEDKLRRLLPRGLISYKLLWAIFSIEEQAVATHEDVGEPCAFTIRSLMYEDHPFSGKRFRVGGQFIEHNGSKFVRSWMEPKIPIFSGLRTIASLTVRPLTDIKRAELTTRGHLYYGLVGIHYLEYTGVLTEVKNDLMGNKTVEKTSANGRTMIDREGYKKANPSGHGNRERTDCFCEECLAKHGVVSIEDEDELDDDELPSDADKASGAENSVDEVHAEIKESEICLLPPTVFGFSFVLKRWGQLNVDCFQPIKYDDEAYQHLVLNETHKNVIRALVESTTKKSSDSGALISDVIRGKGNNLCIVLHGRPGTGKTLTAEAVAEHLHRPLYVVSSGQLGHDAEQLEKNLKMTLELARRWDCCVLIDEADVFLEARSDHELHRNSMVAVFLHLLEYATNVIFLTTNRVHAFDEAFLSRFSVALKYPELNITSRKLIWRKFLKLCGIIIQTSPIAVNGDTSEAHHSIISEQDLHTLADHECNGREIKQIIRAACALALTENVPLQLRHLETVVSFQKDFVADFKNPDTEGMYAAKGGETWRKRSQLYQ